MCLEANTASCRAAAAAADEVGAAGTWAEGDSAMDIFRLLSEGGHRTAVATTGTLLSWYLRDSP
jgi:hypothetical protein